MGIGFQTKSKSKKCTCWLNSCYHSTDKGLHCTKLKKEILNCIEKYWVLRTYWTTLICTGWFESSLGTHSRNYGFARCTSFHEILCMYVSHACVPVCVHACVFFCVYFFINFRSWHTITPVTFSALLVKWANNIGVSFSQKIKFEISLRLSHINPCPAEIGYTLLLQTV